MRTMLRVVLCLVCMIAIVNAAPRASAQDAQATWMSAVIWGPSLQEAGAALSAHVNQIDASCNVDVDVIQSTNGAATEGAVYAFLVAWSCPESNPSAGGLTWQSAMLWQPTLEASAASLAEHLNQTDATCRVDVDDIQSTNGAGPEGPVYAFLVTWAC